MAVKVFLVKVCASARLNVVKQTPQGLKVYVSAPAVDGKANKAVIDLLAKHLKLKSNAVRIIKGELNPQKTIAIQMG